MRGERGTEWRRFLRAVALLTRIPLPPVPFDPDWLPRSAKYLPLVGGLLGVVAASVLLGARQLWPGPIPELVALVTILLLTGALHEDGLADTFDSFGGRTREARLAIMKDSRLGTFGALALGSILAAKLATLAALPLSVAVLAWPAASAGGRFAAVVVMRAQRYAGDPAAAKLAASPGRPTNGEVAVAAAIACLFALPLVLLAPARAVVAVLLGAALAAWLGWRACRGVGGHTGDVLGAVVSVGETGFLLGAAATLGWPVR